jgi:hypothetical protein
MSVELDVSAIVPSFGSTSSVPPFAPLAPSGWFANFSAPTAALRLSASPPRSRAALRSVVPPRGGEAGAPKFLGDPRHTCPGHRPRWSLPEQASAASPLRLALSVLPSEPSDSSASTNPVFRGPTPQPACSLSTLRVGRYFRSRKTRFRLAALPYILTSRPRLAWRTEGGGHLFLALPRASSVHVPGTTRWNRRVRAHIEAAMAAPSQAPVEAMRRASSREMAAMRRTMACGTARFGPWRKK